LKFNREPSLFVMANTLYLGIIEMGCDSAIHRTKGVELNPRCMDRLVCVRMQIY